MLKSHSFKLLGVAAAMGLLMGAANYANATSVIKIDGSSTVYPITEIAGEEFQKNKKGEVKVAIGIAGTTGGFRKFCSGEIDIVNASRPILKDEMSQCKRRDIKFIEIPVAYDALTVVVNSENNWAGSITVAELKKMWEPTAQGKIMSWKQINPAWPDAPLKLFGPDADSGTVDFFTEVIVGKAKSTRLDYTASADDKALVQGVMSDKNAIGYFGYGYYAGNVDKLKAVPIRAGDDKPQVSPSLGTVKDGTYRPLSRPAFIYVNANAAKQPNVREFVEFYLKRATRIVGEARYIPLPANAYELALDNLAKGKTGTGFGGKSRIDIDFSGIANVGMSDSALMRRDGGLFPSP